jgi:hypothetical protein
MRIQASWCRIGGKTVNFSALPVQGRIPDATRGLGFGFGPGKADVQEEVIVQFRQRLALATGSRGSNGTPQDMAQAGNLRPGKGGRRQGGPGVHGKSFRVSSGSVMEREGTINLLDPYAASRHIRETNACDV